MDTSKIIKGVVNSGRYTVTAPIVKEDYGLYLQIEGVELPSTYEVDFSNSEHNGTSVTMIGNADGVLIPHQFIDTGKDIFAFLYHVGADYGRTVYKFRIPNKVRPDRTDEEPTPEEQSTIDQAISALNSAVAQTAQDVIDADASAQASAESARASANSAVQASLSESNAERAKGNAQASAESASASATASAQSASEAETARQATTSLVAEAQGYANASEQSATASANSAELAESAKGVAQSYAQDAQTSATYASVSESTASSKATEASGYAQTASQKASEASQSATNASQSAQTALQAKTDAQTAKTQAVTARDNAVTAKTAAETAQGKAEDAQAAAESVAESIPSDYSQLSEDVSDLKEGLSQVEDIVYYEDSVDFATASSKKGYVQSNGNWSQNANSKSYFVPVAEEDKKVKITANSNKATVIAFLKNNTVTNSTPPNYCDQTSRIVLESNTTKEYDIPSDCGYICVLSKTATASGFEPSEMVFVKAHTIPVINDEQITALFGFEFVTPPVVNICGGIEQNFYYQNMIMGFNTEKAYSIETSAKTTNFDDFARLTPAENASLANQGFKVYLYPYNKNKRVASDTVSYNVVPKSSGSGLTKKILLIGDSLTFNQPLSKHLVDDLLASDAMTVSLIGTLGTAPYLREGRSGWSAHDYVSGYEHGDSFTNAFWNPSTNKFDFSYYMSNNGFSDVDYVFINLGTNIGENTVESMTDDLEEMITSIHAYNSNIRVGVWTPPPRGLMGNGFLTDNDNTLLRVKAIINKFKNRTGERIYIVPVTLNVDPYHDFPYQTVNVSSRNSSFQMVVSTDRTHPADAGYWKMADVIYNYIKYFGSLDAT